MGRRLASYVHVHNEETGVTHVFGPDDTVPAWAEKAITNPGAWEAEPVAVGEGDPGNSGTVADEEAAAEAARAAAEAQGGDRTITVVTGTPGGDGGPDAGNSGGTASEQPPPMGGAGSGADVWRAYAERRGVTVPDDASRDDVVAALRDAGHPVERQ